MLKGILTGEFPVFSDMPLQRELEKSHENGWIQPTMLPSPEEMDIVTIINLLEQDYYE